MSHYLIKRCNYVPLAVSTSSQLHSTGHRLYMRIFYYIECPYVCVSVQTHNVTVSTVRVVTYVAQSTEAPSALSAELSRHGAAHTRALCSPASVSSNSPLPPAPPGESALAEGSGFARLAHRYVLSPRIANARAGVLEKLVE